MAYVAPTLAQLRIASHRVHSSFCPPSPSRLQTGRPTASRSRLFLPPSTTMVAISPSALPDTSASATGVYDIVVIGGGPAGLSLAAGLGARGLSVLCADLTLDKPWPNNYGTWVDDLEPLALADCTSHVWKRVASYVRRDEIKSTLNRDYARVDRHKMKQRFLDRCAQTGNVAVIQAAAKEVDTSSNDETSSVVLHQMPDAPDEKRTVLARVVVDATGHSLRFVQFQDGKPPGVQAAYGIECTVPNGAHPFSPDEMVFMDFRDDHMQSNQEDRRTSHLQPTFLYVMPLDHGVGRRYFFEETSLVAFPAMDFDVLKKRLYKRLDYYNIKIDSILDEEFCFIPMGGAMPDLRQRVVAFGGAAALVHPATGYMIARALKLADSAAEVISQEVKNGRNADETAYAIWDRIWNEGRQRQRDFFNFGGEYLGRVDLLTLKDFLAAFFELPMDLWSSFLSFRLMQPLDRLTFGLAMFVRTTNRVRLSIVRDAITRGGLPLFISVLPFYSVEED